MARRCVIAAIFAALGAAALPWLHAQDAGAAKASMITEGLDPTGRIVMEVGSQVALKSSRPYKRISVGDPDISDINAVGPTQVLVGGKKPGRTTFMIWDDADNNETINVTVLPAGALAASSDWADGVDPVSSATVPGFVRFNLRGRELHVAVSKIEAVAVDDAPASATTTGPAPATRPAGTTRIVLSAEAAELHPDRTRTLIIPAERMSPSAVLETLKRAAATTRPAR